MDKQTQRASVQSKLKLLTNGDMSRRSTLLCSEVIHATDWSHVRAVSCYQKHPRHTEVDTSDIIDFFDTQPHIVLDLVGYDMMAPIPTAKYDLIIVPLVAYDSANNRLGRGGGWYDRFLANQPSAYKLGLGFSEQAVDSIHPGKHDVPLDRVFSA